MHVRMMSRCGRCVHTRMAAETVAMTTEAAGMAAEPIAVTAETARMAAESPAAKAAGMAAVAVLRKSRTGCRRQNSQGQA